MSLTWKIILPLAALVIVSAAVGVYKNQSNNQSTELEPKTTTTEQKTYDPNAKPITDAEINLLLKDAGAESSVEAEEEKDSALITSDKQELNNFDNAYVSTDF